jgi:hypothetical protein
LSYLKTCPVDGFYTVDNGAYSEVQGEVDPTKWVPLKKAEKRNLKAANDASDQSYFDTHWYAANNYEK